MRAAAVSCCVLRVIFTSVGCRAQAEDKRLQINEFIAAVLAMGALSKAAQDEVLLFLQM